MLITEDRKYIAGVTHWPYEIIIYDINKREQIFKTKGLHLISWSFDSLLYYTNYDENLSCFNLETK